MPGKEKKGGPPDIRISNAFRWALFIAATVLTTLAAPVCLNAGSSIVLTDVNADSTCSAQLTINTTSITFHNASPSSTPSVPAAENPVHVTASVQINDLGTVTLTALAGGDLISGPHAIPVDKVTWTVTGSGGNNGGFIAGTMSKQSPKLVGSWTTSGTYYGDFSFFLANSWSYATGTYTQTVTYTLIAP